MKMRRTIFCSAVMLAFGSATALAGDVETDWKAIVALDAGPQEQPQTAEAAHAMVLGHLAKQERTLRGFLAEHPKDARVFEARLRLARLLQIRGDFEESDKLRADGKKLLDELEKTATPEQRVELDFSKVSRLMRNLREVTPARRDGLLSAVRKFQTDHPGDRRIAALLAEVATLFDAQPKTKEELLAAAQPLATDDDLKGRIADDLKRVRLLGEEVTLAFTSAQGREIKLAELRGQPVLVVFFAAFSPPSLAAITSVQRAVAELSRGSVQVLGVNLDEKRETLDAVLKSRAVTWPVAFDGKGWESPLVRGLGINALPTVWLLDARGKLRSLNALQNTAVQIRQLSAEH